jgi:hypothetical protein
VHPPRPAPPVRRVRGVALSVALAALGVGSIVGPAAAEAACEDPLVVLAPEGADGETTAVAVTSQVLERDTPGWASVTWQAAEGTRLTEVVVVTSAGVRTLPGDASGTAEEVLELRFCGTSATSDAAGPGTTGPATTGTAEETTTPVRFASEPDGSADVALGTTRASVLGAVLGLTAGAVVLLMSRSSRRDPEARP